MTDIVPSKFSTELSAKHPDRHNINLRESNQANLTICNSEAIHMKRAIFTSVAIICAISLLACGKAEELPYIQGTDNSISENSQPGDFIEEELTASASAETEEETSLPPELEETEDGDNQESETTLEDVEYPYYCLEVNDPIAQEIIADRYETWISSRIFIKGLVGFTPTSDPFGRLEGYYQDREIIIEKNVGKGLLQSERLAEVKEYILIMVMDIIRNRGENAAAYQDYFADEAMLQQMETYLNTEIEEDWLLLESFYLSGYAGNREQITWYNKNETTWRDEENEITDRLADTDSLYCFTFNFYADYRTMGYEQEDKAASILFSCAVSKETGLIDEISISKWYMRRCDFEEGRY